MMMPPGNLAAYSSSSASVREEPQKASLQFARDGLLHVQGVMDTDVASALESHVARELAARKLEDDRRWFGNVYGYEANGKRWDLKLSVTAEVSAALRVLLVNIQGLLEAIGGTSWKVTELAAMCTDPGDSEQPVHSDTSYMEEHGAVTVFVALHDVGEHRGPTRMYPKTHTDHELHMGVKSLDENSKVLCTMRCGDCVLMDSRLMHGGTTNSSNTHRYLFYCSWMPETSKSRSSTNTILDSYKDCLILSNWRHWIADPPVVLSLPEVDVEASETRAMPVPRRSQDLRCRKFWRGARMRPRPGQRLQLDQLLLWLRGHGVDPKASGIEIRQSVKHGFGVFAVRRIHPGETLVRIPMEAVLHAGKVCKTEFGRQVIQCLGAGTCQESETITPEELLWLYMIWGREEPQKCPWYGYLQSLPSEDPLLWATDHSAIRWVQGTSLSEEMPRMLDRQRSRHASVVGKLSTVLPEMFSMSRYSFSSWLWARSCYVSRAFQRRAFPSDCVEAGWESDFLCPLVDIPNHSPRAEVEWRFGACSAALMLPLSADGYEKGDEVFNMYGAALSNDVLLSHYGFALLSNPHNSVSELSIEMCSDNGGQRRMAELSVSMPEVQTTASNDIVRLQLSQPLHHGVLEIPPDLLRAVCILVLGRDYDEEAASCSDKSEASNAVAKTLRQNLKRTAPRSWFSQGVGSAPKKPKLPPKSSIEHAAAMYAWGQRGILRAAICCAENEAEMAELAALMNPVNPDEDECDDHVTTGELVGADEEAALVGLPDAV